MGGVSSMPGTRGLPLLPPPIPRSETARAPSSVSSFGEGPAFSGPASFPSAVKVSASFWRLS